MTAHRLAAPTPHVNDDGAIDGPPVTAAPRTATPDGASGESTLADLLAATILDDPGFAGTVDAGGHLALVRRCRDAEAVTKSLTQQAVDAARAAGHSWADIGGELGMSRQAAQQRFGGTPDALRPNERWLGPVTAFDELAELHLAGRMGWHTVGAALLRHRMVRTETQWEHRRLLWPPSSKSLLRDGWQIGCRAFPWIYLIRDTGLPAESE